ncbi:hypothetical protein K439DRAFT_1614788 [Ramaria rubella]|nr:hypothetical protein K439DRAFT_1614788 [Ramaria rubella]
MTQVNLWIICANTHGYFHFQKLYPHLGPPPGPGYPNLQVQYYFQLEHNSSSFKLDTGSNIIVVATTLSLPSAWNLSCVDHTSTPEPSSDGIIWIYLKDVSRYFPLFVQPGTLILDMNNIVDASEGLTGEYHDIEILYRVVTLSPTFFASNETHALSKTADGIIPISNRSPNIVVYPDCSFNQTFSINTVQALAVLYAGGNNDGELWVTSTTATSSVLLLTAPPLLRAATSPPRSPIPTPADLHPPCFRLNTPARLALLSMSTHT